MPEIKNTFTQGKMNKDLDERIIPNGQYRDAMNVQVSTSEGSDIGTVQNILGNKRIESIVGSNFKCVGSVSDEKTNKLYWFIKSDNKNIILEFFQDGDEDFCVPVFIDTKANTSEAVLKFPDTIITGINIIDNLLFWTDNENEPRKINIDRCIEGSTNPVFANEIIANGDFLYDSTGWSTLPSGMAWNNGAIDFDGSTGQYYKLNQDISSMMTGSSSGDQYVVKFKVSNYVSGSLIGRLSNDSESVVFPQDATNSSHSFINQNGDYEYLVTLGDSSFAHANRFYLEVETASSFEGTIDNISVKKLPLEQYTHTKLIVDDVNQGDMKEKHITVIKDRPLEAPVVITEIAEENEEKIFEKDFIRFCLRYKYHDGEYSAFGPFTDVVFEPGEFDLPINETYNSGMLNHIKSITLTNLISDTLPLDVVQVDILYKQENSAVVYSIDSFTPSDSEWISDSYTVSSENIRAALPSNQFLRVWDNVPKKALAQEVTGNRIVYANYTQGYDLDTSAQQRPEITMGYERRDESTLSYATNNESGLPSIKSQRNYQLGVVYGDTHGRETPVFTSSNGSINVPWASYDGFLNSTQPNQLTAELKSLAPSWAEYYKVFVKESSGDYFNLSMDRIYQNPIIEEEVEEEQTIWMSFPSSDRNKIKEEDYIILKNKRTAGDNPVAISEKNKFKVLDIKNEAPEAITYEMQSIGSIANEVGVDVTIIDTVFDSVGVGFGFEEGNQILKISKAEWLDPDNGGGMVLESDTDRKEPLYFSFKNLTNGITSKSYLISSIYDTDTGYYMVRLREPITQSDNWAIDTVTVPLTPSIITTFDLQVNIEKRVKKDLNEFTGRFFVKIASTEFTRVGGAGAIEPEVISSVDTTLRTRASAQIYFHADTANSVGDFDPSTGIVNYNGIISQDQIASAKQVTTSTSASVSHSGDAISTRSDDWKALPPKKWFIDSMFFKAGQDHRTDKYSASKSGRIFYGGGTEHIDDVNNSVIDNNFGVGYSSVGTDDGSMMVNGLEGFITTGDIHRTRKSDGSTSYGARNILSQPTYKKIGTNASEDYIAGGSRHTLSVLSNYSGQYRNRSQAYGPGTKERHFIHLSFLAPGQDLHNGSFGGTNVRNWSANDNPNALKNNMQDIMCSGNWKYGNTTTQVFNFWGGPGQQTNEGGDFAEPDWDKVYNAWNPGWNSPENQRVVDRLKKGQKFKLTGSDEIFTIKNDPRILRLYNHTSWHDTYSWDKDDTSSLHGNFKKQRSKETPVGQGSAGIGNERSVEYHATLWANDDNDGTKRDNLATILGEFGAAHNRRVCYIIELDKDPTDTNITDLFQPANLNSEDTQVIEFLENDVDSTGVLSRGKISVWETEPQKSADLNIYHEATNAIPLRLNSNTRSLFAKPGDSFEIFSDTESFTLADFTKPGLPTPKITSWSFSTNLNIDNFAAEDVNDNWIGESIGLPDPNSSQGTYYYEDYDEDYRLYIRIYRQGSSFYTARVIGHVVSSDFKTWNPGIGGTSTKPMVTELILAEENYNLPVGLNWFNCISFNNGVESNKIKDDFNGDKLTSGARANATLEEPYKEENRKSGLIYSGLYNSTSGINDLNQFIMAEKITKDLNPTYGSIQKLFSRRVSLIAFCEDKVVGITANKNALYNADGNPQLVASDAVLGDANPFVGDYGISKNPESFAKDSYRAYFTDKQRGAVLRLSMDGLTPISDAGMHDYFRDHLPTANHLIGSYDSHKQEYNLTLSNYLPSNLIINSTLEEGVESQNIAAPETEILLNTGLTGNDWVGPDEAFNNSSNITTNAQLKSHITITDWPEILPIPSTSSPAIDYIPTTTSDVYNKIPQNQYSNRDLFHIGNYHDEDAFNTGVSMAVQQSTAGSGTVVPWGSGTPNPASGYQYIWSHTATQDANANIGWFFNSASDMLNHCTNIENDSYVLVNVNDQLEAWNGEVIRFKARVRMPQTIYDNNVPSDVKTAANPHLSFRFELVWGDTNIPVVHEYLHSSGTGTGHDTGNYAQTSQVDHIDALSLTTGVGSANRIDINGYWRFRNTKGPSPSQKIAAVPIGGSSMVELDLPLLDIDGTAGVYGLGNNTGNCGVDTDGNLVLYDDDATDPSDSSITFSTSLNADGNYDAVDPMPQPSGEKANSRVFDKVKLQLTAWYTDGSGTSIGPFQPNPDGTASTTENNPNYPGNLGEDNDVSYGIRFITGVKNAWTQACGFQADPSHPDYTKTYFANHGGGATNQGNHYDISFAGQASDPGQTIGSTQQAVPAWSQVEYEVASGAWSATAAAIANGSIDLFANGELQYGVATTTDPSTLGDYGIPGYTTQVATNGTTITETQPGGTESATSLGNGKTLNADGLGSGAPPFYVVDEDFIVDHDIVGGTGQVDVAQTLPLHLVADTWYEIRVTYDETTSTYNSNAGSIHLRDVLENGLTIGQTLPDHVGLTSGASGAIILIQSSVQNVLVARFKLHQNSNMVVNGDTDKLTLLFNNISPAIKIYQIMIFDISTSPYIGSGGNLTHSSNNWSTSNQTPIINFYSSPTLFSENDKVKWVNSVSISEVLAQDFDETGVNSPETTADGYRLKFTISDHDGVGELRGYVNNQLGLGAGGNSEGFAFTGIKDNGNWEIEANFNGDDSNWTIKRDGIADGNVQVSSSAGFAWCNVSLSGHSNKLVFGPINTDGLTCSIDNISLVDMTDTFVSGSVNAWDFTGFDSEYDNFIDFDVYNESIEFNNSPLDSSAVPAGDYAGSTDRIQIEQIIDAELVDNSSYTVNFDHDLTNGSISGYYFNANGNGFRLNDTTGSGVYNKTHKIGDAQDKASDELSETLVLYVNSSSGSGLNGTLDNIFIYREYVNFVPQTVSFSEDVRGWTSFKSFIPESGLSLSKNYYTVKNGKLWRHHDEMTRNWFYGELDGNGDPKITQSTITAVINEEPSLVKIFNTLNYEGSQSKIDKYTTDINTSISNMEFYNLEDKPGWYVESIETDKQKGSINEFIEKEGKWFNYMKGDATDIKTSDLSFQGLGIIKDIL